MTPLMACVGLDGRTSVRPLGCYFDVSISYESRQINTEIAINWLSMVQIMDCCLFGANVLPKPMPANFQSDPMNTIQ